MSDEARILDPSSRTAADLLLVDPAQTHFDATVAALPDGDFAGASLLPGWTRAHVVAHVALNAHAMLNLVDWATTGVEHPMYASAEARDADIERVAGYQPADLRALSRTNARDLAAGWAAIPADRWDYPVQIRSGGTIPLSETVRRRTRELWLHAVDLDAGTTFADLPTPFVDELLEDTVSLWSHRRAAAGAEIPAFVLTVTDRDRRIAIATDGSPEIEVSGTAAALAAWMTGRGTAGVTSSAGAPLPDPPPWS